MKKKLLVIGILSVMVILIGAIASISAPKKPHREKLYDSTGDDTIIQGWAMAKLGIIDNGDPGVIAEVVLRNSTPGDYSFRIIYDRPENLSNISVDNKGAGHGMGTEGIRVRIAVFDKNNVQIATTGFFDVFTELSVDGGEN